MTNKNFERAKELLEMIEDEENTIRKMRTLIKMNNFFLCRVSISYDDNDGIDLPMSEDLQKILIKDVLAGSVKTVKNLQKEFDEL